MKLFQTVLGFGAAAMAVCVGLFAYLGTFSRYLADDYCDTVLVTHEPVFNALLTRYQTVSDRYSNLLFDALSELLGPHNVEIVPVIMIIGWTAALTCLVHAVKRLAGFQWSWLVDFYLAASLVFFAALQAPNRFQTFYWRSSLATHFAPLVYLTAFAALLLIQIRRPDNRAPAIWIGPFFMVAAFLGGGFSEPPDAMLIVAAGLALLAVWVWVKGVHRRAALSLLTWTLMGGLLALLVMKFSPANALRLRTPPPDLFTLINRTLLNTAQFILDSLLTLPVPTIVSVAIPFLLFYALFASMPGPSSSTRRIIFIVLVAIPILMYIFIAASFAPSIYGQSFPLERARFAGRLVMTIALMLEGACFGVMLAGWKVRWQAAGATLALALLALLQLYPLRSAWLTVRNAMPFYSQWSSLWDMREAQILSQKAQGIQDIQLFPLISIQGVKEFDADPNFWVNRCAAEYYGVNSISAP